MHYVNTDLISWLCWFHLYRGQIWDIENNIQGIKQHDWSTWPHLKRRGQHCCCFFPWVSFSLSPKLSQTLFIFNRMSYIIDYIIKIEKSIAFCGFYAMILYSVYCVSQYWVSITVSSKSSNTPTAHTHTHTHTPTHTPTPTPTHTHTQSKLPLCKISPLFFHFFSKQEA